MSKKVLVARVETISGHEDDFLKLIPELIQSTRNELGCLKYDFFQSVSDGTNFVAYEEYVNDDAVQEHVNSEHFKIFFAKTKKLMAKEVEIQIF